MRKLVATISGLLCCGALVADSPKPGILLILDASSSMSERVSATDATAKMVEARTAVKRFAREAPGSHDLAFRFFTNCPAEDRVLAVPFQSKWTAASKIDRVVDELNPTGLTPIQDSLKDAIADFGDKPGEIVLITDDKESCALVDPCEFVKEMRANSDLQLRLHLVGLRPKPEAKTMLECMAKEAGTKYREAENADGLTEILMDIGEEAKKPVRKPQQVHLTFFDLFAWLLAVVVLLWPSSDFELRPFVFVYVMIAGLVFLFSMPDSIFIASIMLVVGVTVLFIGLAFDKQLYLFAVLALLLLVIGLFNFGFTEVRSLDLPRHGILLFLAAIGLIWLITTKSWDEDWLEPAQNIGLALLALLAFGGCIFFGWLQLAGAGSGPSLWTTLFSIVLTALVTLGPLQTDPWGYMHERFLAIVAGTFWLLALGYFLLFEVFQSSLWGLPALGVWLLLQISFVAFPRLQIETWAQAWPSEEIEILLRWGSVALALLFVFGLVLIGGTGIHLWLLAAFLAIRLAWACWQPSRSYLELIVLFVLLVICVVAFFSPGSEGLWTRLPGLNPWLLVVGLVSAVLFIGFWVMIARKAQESAVPGPKVATFGLPGERKPAQKWILEIPYDEKILGDSTRQELEAQFRLLLAIKLVEVARLSEVNAARIADLPLAHFLRELERDRHR